MALRRNGNTLPIAQLEKILQSQRRRLNALEKQRARMRSKLTELDREIASLSGAAAGTASRAHNSMSLVATLQNVFRSAGKPLPVGEILSRVKAAGYRSNSANFRALVNQTLIKEKQFVSAGRGIYKLKR